MEVLEFQLRVSGDGRRGVLFVVELEYELLLLELVVLRWKQAPELIGASNVTELQRMYWWFYVLIKCTTTTSDE